MTLPTHLERALTEELHAPIDPAKRPVDGLAEAMVVGAGSALLISACSYALPFAGAAAGAAIASGVAYKLAEREVRPAVHKHVLEAVDEVLAARTLTPRPEETPEVGDACRAWNAWLPWGSLCDGAKVPVPAELPPPSATGFKKTRLASNVGQARDWVRGLPDGSRLHAHEYADGSVVVHRDQLDPARGPGAAAVHWLSETPEGEVAGWCLVGAMGILAVWAVVG